MYTSHDPLFSASWRSLTKQFIINVPHMYPHFQFLENVCIFSLVFGQTFSFHAKIFSMLNLLKKHNKTKTLCQRHIASKSIGTKSYSIFYTTHAYTLLRPSAWSSIIVANCGCFIIIIVASPIKESQSGSQSHFCLHKILVEACSDFQDCTVSAKEDSLETTEKGV